MAGEIFRNEEVYNEQVKRGEIQADPELDAEYERQKALRAEGKPVLAADEAPAGDERETSAVSAPPVEQTDQVGKVMAPPDASSVEPAPGAETA